MPHASWEKTCSAWPSCPPFFFSDRGDARQSGRAITLSSIYWSILPDFLHARSDGWAGLSAEWGNTEIHETETRPEEQTRSHVPAARQLWLLAETPRMILPHKSIAHKKDIGGRGNLLRIMHVPPRIERSPEEFEMPVRHNRYGDPEGGWISQRGNPVY
ncbi:hypothetical protein BJV74DRAFT_793377 [Russula compacta]|nr:hypothetical protein BJV74DRAFT_793377 [Russula compacta]